MKKLSLLITSLILFAGCQQNEFSVSFNKSSVNNNVFEKSEVNCSFKQTQILSGKPNYEGGNNPAYDFDPSKESFSIGNSTFSQNDNDPGLKLKLIGLNSDTPKIVGNVGEEELMTFKNNLPNPITKIFFEKGPWEHQSISAFNISENGSAIWIKSYEMVDPFSIVFVGYCE